MERYHVREHQVRAYRMYNLHLVDAADCLGGVWPPVRPSQALPRRLTTFYPKTAGDNGDAYAHFFIDDYRFERVWSDPERYIPVLRKYGGAVMPDFSTYHIMPLPMQWWNVYRSRMLAHYWQENGIDVIPLLQCGDPRMYDYALEGMPVGGTYAIATNGQVQDKANLFYLLEFLEIALDAVRPDLLVAYGKKLDVKLPCEVIWYTNDNTNRVAVNTGRLEAPLPDYIDEGNVLALADARERAMLEAESEVAPIGLSGDGYVRAVSTLRPEERRPLMFNEELPNWTPWYADEAVPLLPSADDMLLPSEDGETG